MKPDDRLLRKIVKKGMGCSTETSRENRYCGSMKTDDTHKMAGTTNM